MRLEISVPAGADPPRPAVVVRLLAAAGAVRAIVTPELEEPRAVERTPPFAAPVLVRRTTEASRA